MQYTKLGSTGTTVSRICLGCMSYGGGPQPSWAIQRDWAVGVEEAGEHFRIALDAGVNFFDTANTYSVGASEQITGRWLNEMASRDEIVVATKVHGVVGPGPNQRGLSRKHIIQACEASLRRLNMDYIDLYQIHRWDPETPIEETLDALDALVRAGKVRYLGCSNLAAWQLAKALFTAREHHWHRFVSMQNHYNLIYREEEQEVIPLCVDQGLAVIPWSPLGAGFLAGNRSRESGPLTTRARSGGRQYRDDDYAILDAVEAVARAHGASPAQIACAWVMQAPGITAPIVGATRAQHVKDLIGAVDIKLSPEEVKAMEAPYQPHPITGRVQGRQSPIQPVKARS